MNRPPSPDSIHGFLDAVAARKPTPGGGAVAAAAGALSCATARMVAEYSPGKNASPEARGVIVHSLENLQRADPMLRALIDEDARAYTALNDAARKLKQDPAARPDHDAAVGVAIAVPLQVAALAAEVLSILERLLPAANRFLLSDLGVAAVLADAAVRASSYMVRVNTAELADLDARREPEAETQRLVARSAETCRRIEAELADRV